jgi:5-methyltetrahydrofolate--homocysteine methyltransferase
MSNPVIESITNSLVEIDLEGTIRGIQQALEKSIPINEIIRDGLTKGMEIVGTKFENGEYFLAELISAGAIMEEASALLDPHIKAESVTSSGIVVAGTVQGDLHDIGKNILISMLKSAAFKIVDLGVDINPEEFVEKTKKVEADIVCISALLSVVVPELEETVRALKQGVPGVKILVGGRCVDEKMAERIGAFYAKDAWAGTKLAVELMKKK